MSTFQPPLPVRIVILRKSLARACHYFPKCPRGAHPHHHLSRPSSALRSVLETGCFPILSTCSGSQNVQGIHLPTSLLYNFSPKSPFCFVLHEIHGECWCLYRWHENLGRLASSSTHICRGRAGGIPYLDFRFPTSKTCLLKSLAPVIFIPAHYDEEPSRGHAISLTSLLSPLLLILVFPHCLINISSLSLHSRIPRVQTRRGERGPHTSSPGL